MRVGSEERVVALERRGREEVHLSVAVDHGLLERLVSPTIPEKERRREG